MKWSYTFTAAATRHMDRLDRQNARRVLDALDELALEREANADQPRAGAAKALRGRDGEARLMVGKLRVVFQVEQLAADPDAGLEEPQGLIVVLQVEGRDQVYRHK